MAYITKYISDKVTPYSFYITIAWLALIFFGAGVLYFYFYFRDSPYNFANYNKNTFNDVANKQTGSGSQHTNLTFYYFYVTWCPYCTKAKPIIESFKEKYTGWSTDKYNLIIVDKDLTEPIRVNSDKDLMKDHKVDSFPTIFIINENTKERYDFKARVTMDNLTKFINSYK
jgi:hypothetical protein